MTSARREGRFARIAIGARSRADYSPDLSLMASNISRLMEVNMPIKCKFAAGANTEGSLTVVNRPAYRNSSRADRSVRERGSIGDRRSSERRDLSTWNAV